MRVATPGIPTPPVPRRNVCRRRCLFVALSTVSVLTISGFLSTAGGHDRPDLRRTLDYIASNIESGARFESNDCSIKMADVRSTAGIEMIRFSLSDVDLSKGDAD